MKEVSNNKGFTLIELLATIAVLSIVITIVIYSATNVLDVAKNKSYLVTINNIESSTNSYVSEKLGGSNWVLGSSINGYNEYQCVSIQNLIDSGYFKNDILDSYVAKNRKVLLTDYVYLERDLNTKSIVENILLIDSMYNGLCGFDMDGAINMSVNPYGWSREKIINIQYNIYNMKNADDFKKYKYEYRYKNIVGDIDLNGSGNFSSVKHVEEKTVRENGTMDANIIITMPDLTEKIISHSLLISKIDNEKPVGEIVVSNYIDTSQSVELNMRDKDSGLSAYYFGRDNPEEKNVSWIAINGSDEKTVKTMVDVEGAYFLGIKDLVGNVGVYSVDIAKTNLHINHGSIIPNYIITKIGNVVSLHTPEMEENYLFDGWYDNESFSGSVIGDYAPIKYVNNLYGKVRLKEFTVIYRNNGGTGIMSDTVCKKSENCVIKSNEFSRIGYTFDGWTTKSDGSNDGYGWTGWSGKWNFSNGQYGIKDNKLILYARWKKNKVTIKYNASGGIIQSSAGGYNWSLASNGDVMRDDAPFELTMYYGDKIISSGVANYNNGNYINISKNDSWVKDGEEWVCLSGDCVGETYDHDDNNLDSHDFCDASNSDCTVVLGVNWKTYHNVIIRYSVRGGNVTTPTTAADGTKYNWTTNANGVIKLNGSYLEYKIKANQTLSDVYSSGLVNWDNANYLKITKTGKIAESGKEWICLTGSECDGKTFGDSVKTYKASDFCDASNSDCTVVLGPNWETTKVIIKYSVNGGSIQSSAGGYNWSKDSNGIIKQNGSVYKYTYNYGNDLSADGLANWNNANWINVSKTGHSAVSGAEWKCMSGCRNSNDTFSHSTKYKSSDFCDASNSDCTVILGVNWKANTYTITYNKNGGYSAVASDGKNDSYCNTSLTGNHDVSGTMDKTTCTYGEKCALRKNAYTKKCHNFKGWTTYTDSNTKDYTDSITNATVASGNKFYVNSDNFTYNKAGNITLYAVWENNHKFKGIGNHLSKTSGSFTCGKTHTVAYNIYCTECGMSAGHYNYCYKKGYEDSRAVKFCPNGVGDPTKTFNDRSYYGFSSSSAAMGTDKAHYYGGTYEGTSAMSVVCNDNCASVVKDGH